MTRTYSNAPCTPITLAILKEFLVNSLFQIDKNPNGGYEGSGVL
jgi:hypothetical protein